MTAQLRNNISDTLLNAIDSSQTSFDVTSGNIPALSAGDYSPIHVVRSSDGAFEIMHVTDVSGSTLTVSRQQEGTDPLTFNAGDLVQIRPTRQSMAEMESSDTTVATSTGSQTLVGALEQRGPVFETVADLISSTDVMVGIKCRTLGYNAIGDGGGNDYEIVAGGTGTDDGGSFIDLSGSGHQARGLFPGGYARPAQFGAVEGTSNDSTAAIHAALDFFFSSGNHYVFDGGGKQYGVSASYVRTSAIARKQVTNMFLQAMSGFTGEAILDLQPSSGSLNNLHFTNCTFKGAGGQSGSSNVDGLLLMNSTQGVWIDNCEFNIASLYAIKDLNTEAACEVYITKCRIACSSQSVGNETAKGIWLAGNDSVVADCLIRECQTHAQFEKGAVFFTGNHIYNFNTNKDTAGLVFNDAKSIVADGNYIDGVKIRLVEPRGISLSNNKFLIQNADDWSGFRSFVIFKSNTASLALQEITSTGNTFKSNGGVNPRAYTSDQDAGTFDPTLTDEVFIKNNTHQGVNEATSHPVGIISYASSSSGNVDLGSFSPFGASMQDAYNIVRSCLLNSSSGPVGVRAGITGSAVFTSTDAATSGNMVVEATMNVSGK